MSHDNLSFVSFLSIRLCQASIRRSVGLVSVVE